MRKIFLIPALLFADLSYGQSHRYPVFPDDGLWPEKGTTITVVIISVLVFFIICLIVIIIRKSKERGRKTIIDGFDSTRFGKGYIMHSLFRESSGKYNKRRDRNKGLGSGTGLGGFGSGW